MDGVVGDGAEMAEMGWRWVGDGSEFQDVTANRDNLTLVYKKILA
jgi:hypothetical protein